MRVANDCHVTEYRSHDACVVKLSFEEENVLGKHLEPVTKHLPFDKDQSQVEVVSMLVMPSGSVN